jgi:hypothetical protein
MVYYSVTEDDDHAIGAWMPRNDVGFQTVTVIGQCLFWSLMTQLRHWQLTISAVQRSPA